MNNIYGQRRILTTAALATFGIGFLAGIERGEGVPTARFIIGVGLAFTICSMMVDLGSPMGAGFAVLIMVSAALYQGEDALKLLGVRARRRGKEGRRARAADRRERAREAAAMRRYDRTDAPDQPEGF